ncbi:MAG: T9SS type A sorting domain-containing protein [Crocinitomicaceae bacterium]
MKNLILLFSFVSVYLSYAQSGNNYAINAEPFCLGVTYTANANTPAASVLDPGNDYNCLFTQPNPSWYFVKTLTPGTIELELSASVDIDYMIYGPFYSYNQLLAYNGQYGVDTAAGVHDCSYAPTNVESPLIQSNMPGEYYLFLVTNYAGVTQQITLNQTGGTGSLDCTVYSDVAKHFIKGNVYYDVNQNGVRDTNDIGFDGVSVHIDPLGYDHYNYSSVGYSFATDTNIQTNYTVSFNGLVNWGLTTPASYNFILDSVNYLADSIDFGLYPDTFFVDGSIDVSSNSIQCILNSFMSVTLGNQGTSPSRVNYSIELPPDISFSNSYYPHDSVIGQTVYFSGMITEAMQTSTFWIELSTSGNLSAGDTVCFYSYAEFLDTTTNNVLHTQYDTVCFIVECSYDPNDKTAFVGGFHQQESIDTNEYLEYLINFENTGNALAIDVEILDQLVDNLDASTFEFIASSHPVQYSIDSNNLLRIYYQDILLPFTLPDSRGYFKFRIYPVDSVLPNDVIMNSAEIYFDNNPPIYTDTVVNIMSCYLKPDQPDLFVIASNIIASGVNVASSDTVKWYLDGQLLSGSTGDELNISAEGMYVMEVINEYGCTTLDSINIAKLKYLDNLLDRFVVYPNPSSEKFVLTFDIGKTRNLEILDLKGRILWKGKTHLKTVKIDVRDFDSGTYILRIRSEDGYFQEKKLIKL